jgi:hypothetical protein
MQEAVCPGQRHSHALSPCCSVTEDPGKALVPSCLLHPESLEAKQTVLGDSLLTPPGSKTGAIPSRVGGDSLPQDRGRLLCLCAPAPAPAWGLGVSWVWLELNCSSLPWDITLQGRGATAGEE